VACLFILSWAQQSGTTITAGGRTLAAWAHARLATVTLQRLLCLATGFRTWALQISIVLILYTEMIEKSIAAFIRECV
jgi:hypothetical protein